MRKLLFTIASIVVIIAAVLLLSPYFIGLYLSTNYQSIINRLPHDKTITLTVQSYNRGWFSDQAVINVNLAGAKLAIDNKQSIQIHQTIKHGFLLRTTKGYRWGLAAVSSQTDKASGLVATNHLQLGMGGRIQSLSTIKSLSIKNPSYHIQVTDAQSKSQIEKNKYTTTTTAQTMQVNKINNQPLLAATDLRTTSHFERDADDSSELQHSVNIATLNLHDSMFKQADIKDFMLQLTEFNRAKDLSVHYRLYAKSLAFTNYDPFTVDLDFTLQNLNRDLLNKLHEGIWALENNRGPAAFWLVIQDISAIFHHGMTIQLNRLYMSTANGPISLAGTINLPKATSPAAMLRPLAHLDAKLHGKVPQEWLKQQIIAHAKRQDNKDTPEKVANDQIAYWIQQGLMRTSDKELLFTLDYKGGKFYLATPDHKHLAKFYWTKHPQSISHDTATKPATTTKPAAATKPATTTKSAATTTSNNKQKS